MGTESRRKYNATYEELRPKHLAYDQNGPETKMQTCERIRNHSPNIRSQTDRIDAELSHRGVCGNVHGEIVRIHTGMIALSQLYCTRPCGQKLREKRNILNLPAQLQNLSLGKALGKT